VPGQVGRSGWSYYRKKIREGKTRKEALRCLKRRVCDAVFISSDPAVVFPDGRRIYVFARGGDNAL
jgi:hypothetical protein